jgi:diphthamide biosynthesis methyltransferase
MKSPQQDDYQRIKSALRKAAVERNAKTALILGAAASGAVFGLTGLAITAAGATIALSVMKLSQDRK